MKNILAISVFVFLISQACKTPSAASTSKATSSSMTIVSFNSICCGVRSDEFLKNFYESFKNDNKVRLTATKATGCGKEGEYKVMFATGSLSAELQQKFAAQLKAVVDNETKANTGNSFGTVNISVADSVDISYCRGGEKSY